MAAPADYDNPFESELKYLDLDLEKPDSVRPPAAPAHHQAATEYREIDFVKTKALQDTKDKRREDIKKLN
jgi:hypothetical protein